ncbi:hypothetical protein [uncultured Ruminococcus sp.]|uniref:hypothetical protein n=1 Tax=uncultured Ruminococcus sp. TaxID=165186 RepID=UPI0025D78F6C|nr:hypothetical protein [uncultured Ruminococcus sp.]
MIYNESEVSLINLENALKELSFDQQIIALAMDYLDITKPRNNDLLRKITTRCYSRLFRYDFREKLDKTVKSEMLGSGSEKLKERYAAFSL